MTLTRTMPLLTALALAAAGCGSSSSKTSSQPAAPAPKAGGTTVEMKNIQFSPKEQAVKVGTTVTWTNQDDVAHNVVATGGAAKFESSTFGKGGTYSFTPTKPGKISYTCTLHPGMDGVLNVTA
jgi:plastocyanin